MSVNHKTERFITLKDIAQTLHLSVNAVSKALRDCSDISEDTKKRVRAKAKELGYIPNHTATSLRYGKTNNIAVVFNDFYNPYFSIFCNRVCMEINHEGFQSSLIFCQTNLMDMSNIENILINKFCGVISFVEPTAEVADFFRKRGIPFLLIGIHSNSVHVDCIYTDDVEGGRLVGRYFVKSDFQKALYVTNSFSETSYRRYSGFAEVVSSSNKPFELIPYQLQEDVINKAFAKIKSEHFDFVFCFSDSLAITLLSYLKAHHYDEKVQIIGYDNLHKYYPLIQPIDSIDSDMDAIIRYVVDQIVAKINGDSDMHERLQKIFPVRLAIHED